MKLSANFTLEELTRTGTGLPNKPSPDQLRALQALCIMVLQPMRDVFGPLRITSGLRVKAVNEAVGGAPTSQHLKGEAADIIPLNPLVTRDALWGWLVARRIEYDQGIRYEGKPHLHVSYTQRRSNRHSLLVHGAEGYRPLTTQG